MLNGLQFHGIILYSTQWDEILSEAFACRSSDIEVMDSNLVIPIMTKIIYSMIFQDGSTVLVVMGGY